jgi:hypothetical protein
MRREAREEPEKLDFGFDCDRYGSLRIWEFGKRISPWKHPREYCSGDYLAVKVVGETVRYYHNHKVVYVSKRRPVFPLVIDCRFRDAGAQAEKVQIVVAPDEQREAEEFQTVPVLVCSDQELLAYLRNSPSASPPVEIPVARQCGSDQRR